MREKLDSTDVFEKMFSISKLCIRGLGEAHDNNSNS